MSFNVKELCESIKSRGSALIALSGGVDSSVVEPLAKKTLGDSAVAMTIDNGVLSTGEVARASRVAV
jgi:PP-loop superfamily ATP-utilizing enzyme